MGGRLPRSLAYSLEKKVGWVGKHVEVISTNVRQGLLSLYLPDTW